LLLDRPKDLLLSKQDKGNIQDSGTEVAARLTDADLIR
jgi:hypothetical protein